MTQFYNYDTRGASAASQIITLERMLSEREEQIQVLYEKNQALQAELNTLQAETAEMREALQASYVPSAWTRKEKPHASET